MFHVQREDGAGSFLVRLRPGQILAIAIVLRQGCVKTPLQSDDLISRPERARYLDPMSAIFERQGDRIGVVPTRAHPDYQVLCAKRAELTLELTDIDRASRMAFQRLPSQHNGLAPHMEFGAIRIGDPC